MWSRHLDLKTPGDRRSNCGARMKPIGLAFKQDGELMITHRCMRCGKISNNRIAGDDNTYSITSLISSLSCKEDKEKALICLYGYNYEKYYKI